MRKKYFLLILSVLMSVLMIFGACGPAEAEDPARELPSSASLAAAEGTAGTPEDEGNLKLTRAFLVLNVEEGGDIILRAYRDPAFKGDVTAFFGDLTGSPDIAELVLENASAFDIAPALAFSLCKEESAYNSRAKNNNRNGTTDRGLFQLNSATFPNLAAEDFFDPGVNAKNGLSHLRWCLNTAGNEVSALAMYNAGATRVRSAGTPKSTLDYVSRILKRQHEIEKDFLAEYYLIEQARIAEAESAEKPEKAPFWLSLLTPLGRR